MSPATLAALALGLVVGLLLGYLIGINVHVEPVAGPHSPPGGGRVVGMTRTGRFTRRASAIVQSRLFLVTVLTIGLVLSASAAFFNVHNAGRVTNLVDCSARYNVDSGIARDARGHAFTSSLSSELRLWRKLRAQIQGDTGTRREVLAAIDQRILKLRRYINRTDRTPYPSPYACNGDTYDPNRKAPR